MAQSSPQFPAEIWNHIFGYLSAADKFNVRTSCKYFKKLVDHGSLWRDWTVVLDFKNGSYNSQFWATLRSRKVTSMVMMSTKAKDFKQLALTLPTLTTVIMARSTQESLSCVKYFPHLKRLAVRGSSTPLLLDASTVCQPQQLTHLSMCGFAFSKIWGSFISAVSQFTNLTSLVWHQRGIFGETIWMIHSILKCLPKLKHLSVCVVHTHCAFHSIPTSNPDSQAPDLSSLELIDCLDHALPEDAMRLMPGLKHLAVFYKHSTQEIAENLEPPVHHLGTWLHDLPQLSTLVIVKGPPVMMYASSIPASVTSLTLCVTGLSTEDMAAVAVQVPNLVHLHVDPWPSHLGAHVAEIPRQFPKLRSLKIRHDYVPKKDFLHLHKLQDLKYLEILDNRPFLSELITELQAVTKNRFQVTTSHKRDFMACSCVYQAC